jgi:excisionase family DNA binding protein
MLYNLEKVVINMAEAFLTVEQAARQLQVAPYTLRDWLKTGRLRGIKLGREWRVPERALRELSNGAAQSTLAGASGGESTLSGFLAKAEALTQRLEGAGFGGVDSAELIRDAREERARRVAGEGR